MQAVLLLDNQYSPDLKADLGKIGIRVVVFSKKQGASSQSSEDQPGDLEIDEDFSIGDTEVNSYLELPKRGRLSCVFLINGQRHHGLDNGFIVNDLKMKYLRKRMIVVVDLDGLSQKAKWQIVQNWEAGLDGGPAFDEVRKKIVSTLLGDAELNQLADELYYELDRLQSASAGVQNLFRELIRTRPQLWSPRGRYS
jgi:hypothetical protein